MDMLSPLKYLFIVHYWRLFQMTLEANKPHACTYCAFRTTSEQKLTDHIKRKHHEIAITMGLMSEQEWYEMQVGGGVGNKEKKSPEKKKKGLNVKDDTSMQPATKLGDLSSELNSTAEATLIPANYITTQAQSQAQQILQHHPYTKEEAHSPVPMSPHVDIHSPPARPAENIVQSQLIQTSQPVPHHQVPPPQQIHVQPSHHSIYHSAVTPSTAQVVAISQNHSLTHHHHGHHAGTTGTTTQVVTHHQPGTDLVPPYIASVMIEGVLPPEMQAQLQTHWPYQ